MHTEALGLLFPPAPSDGCRDQAPSVGIHTASLLAAREKSAKGKSEGEVCTHQKELISAKSRLFKNHTDSHLPAAPAQSADEMGFSSARTGFRACRPSGDEALPASPALSQGPHPGWLGDGESQHPQPLDWEHFLLEKKYVKDLETGSRWI